MSTPLLHGNLELYFSRLLQMEYCQSISGYSWIEVFAQIKFLYTMCFTHSHMPRSIQPRIDLLFDVLLQSPEPLLSLLQHLVLLADRES
jgi:hypothetical protein